MWIFIAPSANSTATASASCATVSRMNFIFFCLVALLIIAQNVWLISWTFKRSDKERRVSKEWHVAIRESDCLRPGYQRRRVAKMWSDIQSRPRNKVSPTRHRQAEKACNIKSPRMQCHFESARHGYVPRVMAVCASTLAVLTQFHTNEYATILSFSDARNPEHCLVENLDKAKMMMKVV